MSSYNEIAKIKYEQESSDPVTLLEYVLFGDERAQKKVIVFKFANNVNQQLLGMAFEVSQYNGDGDLIEKSVAIYGNFLAKANDTFVPKAKLSVDYDCEKISVRLIKAAFDRFIWDEGKYIDNTYKFSHYVHDEELIDGRKAAVAAASQPKPRKEPRPRTYAFSTRNVTRKNIAKFPAVFNWIVCILVVAFVAVSLYFYRTRSNRITVKDYDLKIVSEENQTVTVCGYYGTERALLIPAQIGKYSVIGIEKGAFKGSGIYVLEIETSLTIAEGAFVNCKKLASVIASDDCYVTVQTKAFTNCAKLNTIYMLRSSISENSFYGSFGVTEINVGTLVSGISNYKQLFGADDLTEIAMPRNYSFGSSVPSYFFEGVS